MLHTIGWRSLEHRRATSRLCILFQIYHGSIGIPHDPYILPYRHTPRPSRQTYMHTLATYQCRTNFFECSFFPQTIVAWNSLPKSVVTSSTLGGFKVALGRPIPSLRFWTHQLFMFLVLQPILTQLLSFGFTFLLSCFSYCTLYSPFY